MSFSFLVFVIWFFSMRMSLLIRFMAYICLEYWFCTKNTLPKDPLSITFWILKSSKVIGLLSGLVIPGRATRQVLGLLSIIFCSFSSFSYLLYLVKSCFSIRTKSSNRSSSSNVFSPSYSSVVFGRYPFLSKNSALGIRLILLDKSFSVVK